MLQQGQPWLHSVAVTCNLNSQQHESYSHCSSVQPLQCSLQSVLAQASTAHHSTGQHSTAMSNMACTNGLHAVCLMHPTGCCSCRVYRYIFRVTSWAWCYVSSLTSTLFSTPVNSRAHCPFLSSTTLATPFIADLTWQLHANFRLALLWGCHSAPFSLLPFSYCLTPNGNVDQPKGYLQSCLAAAHYCTKLRQMRP